MLPGKEYFVKNKENLSCLRSSGENSLWDWYACLYSGFSWHVSLLFPISWNFWRIPFHARLWRYIY